MWEGLVQDLRYAMRRLRHGLGVNLTVIGTLALGIGATTAIFSVVHGVVLRQLPYPDGDRLVARERSGHRTMGETPPAGPRTTPMARCRGCGRPLK